MSESSPVEVSVQILQKQYRLQCMPEDVESLRQSAQTLSEYMREMRESLPRDVFSNEKLAIAVAVNLIGTIARQESELVEVADRAERLKKRVLDCNEEVS
ncbi:MAG: cell division protein ZapA [Gammaproteobacteria bacterium]|nr:cell division protein ZapA [Gammaproteobacteria bacterium]